jgi:hypothetical protein
MEERITVRREWYLGRAWLGLDGRSFPLSDFFREAEDLQAGAVPGYIREGSMTDKIIITIVRVGKLQDRHQEKAFVKKVLRYLDPILVFKPDDGLMFR